MFLLSTIVVLGTQSEGGEVEAGPGPKPKPSHDSKQGVAELPSLANVVPGVKKQVEEPGGKVDETGEKRRELPHPQAPDKHDGGREKEGGEKAGDKGRENAGVEGGKGEKLDSKERGGGEEKGNEVHQNIQQQVNALHERLEKVEGENRQLKEWQKGMEQQQHQEQQTPLPGAGQQEQGHSDQHQTVGDQHQTVGDQHQTVGDQHQTVGDQQQTVGDQQQTVGDHKQTVNNGGDRSLAPVKDQQQPQQQEVPAEKLEPLNPQQNPPGNKVPQTLQLKQATNEEHTADISDKLQSPNTNNPQDANAVPTSSVLTQDHKAKREVRDVEGKVQEEPGVGDRKEPDVRGDHKVNSNPRENSPRQTDEMQAAVLPKNTSQDAAEHKEAAKNLQPETVKQKSEAAENEEVLATKTNAGNVSMVEGETNQHKDSATATASLGREEGRRPSRELKNIIKEET